MHELETRMRNAAGMTEERSAAGTKKLVLAGGIGFAAIVLVIAAILTQRQLESSSVQPDPYPERLEASTPELIDRAREPSADARTNTLVTSEDSITDDSSRAVVDVASARASPTIRGTLVLQAVDRSRLGPLRWFDVRVASATRFASERSDDFAGELALMLTPGTYGAFVSSPGYESVETTSLEVQSGETLRAPPIVLEPGAGALRVRVIGDASPDRTFTLVLNGTGRHPCERCGEGDDAAARDDPNRWSRRAWERSGPCAHCGFASAQSSRWIRCRQEFEFTNLASGSYSLRLSDEQGRTVGDERVVTLAPRGWSSVVFDATCTRDIEVEIVDVDGSSLTEEWRRRLAGTSSVTTVAARDVVDSEGLQFTLTDQDHQLVNATVVPPDPSGLRRTVPASFGGRRMGARVAKERRPGEIVDRARGAKDALRPVAEIPVLAVSKIEIDMTLDGLVTIGRAPSSALEVRVSSAHSFGEASIRASTSTTRVVVRLNPR